MRAGWLDVYLYQLTPSRSEGPSASVVYICAKQAQTLVHFDQVTWFLMRRQIARANQASFDTAMQCVELFMDFSRFCRETSRTIPWLQLLLILHMPSEAISRVMGPGNDF
jgi:hypothetical protein